MNQELALKGNLHERASSPYFTYFSCFFVKLSTLQYCCFEEGDSYINIYMSFF